MSRVKGIKCQEIEIMSSAEGLSEPLSVTLWGLWQMGEVPEGRKLFTKGNRLKSTNYESVNPANHSTTNDQFKVKPILYSISLARMNFGVLQCLNPG